MGIEEEERATGFEPVEVAKRSRGNTCGPESCWINDEGQLLQMATEDLAGIEKAPSTSLVECLTDSDVGQEE